MWIAKVLHTWTYKTEVTAKTNQTMYWLTTLQDAVSLNISVIPFILTIYDKCYDIRFNLLIDISIKPFNRFYSADSEMLLTL